MPIRKAIWNSMLDADMNTRYWKYLVYRYSRRDTTLKIFLAVMTSGTVAGWGIWVELAYIWKMLSSLSALLAIALPILNYPKKIESMAELSGKWGELLFEYEDLWLEVDNNPSPNTLNKNYRKFRTTEKSLVKKETKLPTDKRLIDKCQIEVNKSRGLQLRNKNE
ncbi:MAG: hypothetical protein WAW41_03835 [Methylobacter sp.]